MPVVPATLRLVTAYVAWFFVPIILTELKYVATLPLVSVSVAGPQCG